MKNLFLIIALICGIFTSCTKENAEPIEIMDCMDISIAVDISLNNQDGENLLDTATKNHFSEDSIKLYYAVDGNKILASDYDSHEDGTRLNVNQEGEPYLRIFTSMDKSNTISDVDGIQTGEAITYLELNSQITDTIKTEWKSTKCIFQNTKVWYNGVLQESVSDVIEVIH